MLQVYDDSPASEAGLSRGDRIVTVNGQSVASMVANGTIGSAFGATDDRRRDDDRVGDAGRRAALGAHGQAARHHSDGVADARGRRRRPPCRLLVLPQLRPAVDRRAERRVRGVEDGRRQRTGAGSSLQRRRPG